MTPSIQDVKRRHTEALMSLAGVVAVGIGIGDDGADQIVVAVRRGDDETASRVPPRLEGYRVVVHFTGEIRAL